MIVVSDDSERKRAASPHLSAVAHHPLFKSDQRENGEERSMRLNWPPLCSHPLGLDQRADSASQRGALNGWNSDIQRGGEGCRRLPKIQHLHSPGSNKAANAALWYRHVLMRSGRAGHVETLEWRAH